MSETASPPPREVPCRRVQRSYEVEEHLRCPYCFGTQDEIRTGDYRCFCNFEPGVDPIAFGFPGTPARWWVR